MHGLLSDLLERPLQHVTTDSKQPQGCLHVEKTRPNKGRLCVERGKKQGLAGSPPHKGAWQWVPVCVPAALCVVWVGWGGVMVQQCPALMAQWQWSQAPLTRTWAAAETACNGWVGMAAV